MMQMKDDVEKSISMVHLSVRGKLFQGKVVKAKAKDTVVLRKRIS